MKSSMIVVVLWSMILGLACVSSETPAPPAPAPFGDDNIHILTQDGQQEVCSMIELNDGGVALAGYSRDTAGTSWQLLFLRLDETGNLLWRKTYPAAVFGRAKGICETATGDLLVCATDGDATTGQRRARILCLDAGGELRWERTYADRGTLDFCCMAPSRDGSFLVGGGAVDYAADGKTQNPLYLMKCNEQGDVLWEKRYYREGCHAWFNQVMVSEGHIFGFGEGGWERAGDWQGIMACLDMEGNVEWIRTAGGDGNEEGYGLTGSWSRGVTGTGFSPSGGRSRGYAVRFGNRGDLRWIRFFQETNIVDAVSYDSGHTLALGFRQGQMVHHLLDDRGDVVWTRRQGVADAQLETRVLAASRHGGFFTCGVATRQGDDDIFFVRLSTGDMSDYHDVAPPIDGDCFDWRDAGIMTAVKDQNPGDTCWAFASTGLLEAMIRKEHGLDLDLAEQHLVNSVPEAGPFAAMDHLRSVGLLREQEAPYLGGVSDPSFVLSHAPLFGIVGHQTLALREMTRENRIRAVQDTLRHHGPLLVSLTLYADLHTYNGGIYRYDRTSRAVAGHIVIIVGWDCDSAGRLYWICKNSWGPQWGERGYFRIYPEEAGIATEYGIWVESTFVHTAVSSGLEAGGRP